MEPAPSRPRSVYGPVTAGSPASRGPSGASRLTMSPPPDTCLTWCTTRGAGGRRWREASDGGHRADPAGAGAGDGSGALVGLRLAPYLVHVEGAGLRDEVLEGVLGQRARLGVQHHPVPD